MRRTPTQTPDVRLFKLACIHPGTNTRETVDQEELASLAESMRHSRERLGSTLQPLLGKLRPDGEVELIAGYRRLLAAPLAGYEEMEVKVVSADTTEADVLLWNLTENLQREQLKPMEFAAGVMRMLALTVDSVPVYSQASLAAELGKPAPFINWCVNAMKTTDKVKAAINDGRICLETGALIGALPEGMRDEAAREIVFPPWGEPMDRDKARKYIAEHCRRDLRKVQWKKEDADLVPEAGPCTKCPMWGGLRDDVDGKLREHTCLNPKCCEAKTKAYNDVIRRHAEDEGTKVIENVDRIFQSWNDELKPECGYVELKSKPDAHLLAGAPSAKTPAWEKIVQDRGVPVVIAFDQKGRARKLIETKLAVEAAKLSEYATIFKVGAEKGIQSLDEKRYEQQITKAENKAREAATVEGCAELLQALTMKHTREMKLALLKQIMDAGNTQDDADMLCRVMQPDMKSVSDPSKLFWQMVDERLTRDEQVDAMIVLARNVRSIRYNGFGHVKHSMTAYCEGAEFDAGAWKESIDKRVKAAAAEARAKVKEKLKAEHKKRPQDAQSKPTAATETVEVKEAVSKPGKVEINDDLKAKARKLYDEGNGKGTIAKALGISENTVGNWQKREWPKRGGEVAGES
ncbi:MAG: ParB N-terminal domain-containing protein [Verrucomicrobiaceae bacterium]|nr:ParB N-terminal domain-containing protein [Verrucomicrobiaceae bacterium]